MDGLCAIRDGVLGSCRLEAVSRSYTVTNLTTVPLESFPELFDDETHERLDKAVNEADDFDSLSGDWRHRVLLTTMVALGEDMDRKYINGQEEKMAVNTHGGLRDVLSFAWERKTYREIRNLGAFLQFFLPLLCTYVLNRCCASHFQGTSIRRRRASI